MLAYENMTTCYWPFCNSETILSDEKIRPFINSHVCDLHINYQCLLCGVSMTAPRFKIKDIKNNAGIDRINYHFMSIHTLKSSSKNYVYWTQNDQILSTSDFYRNMHERKQVSVSDIIKFVPHFIYLIPEFSISDMLDQFDEVIIPYNRLLSALRHRQFSCLLCEGRFESFPSNEVFAAHKCKK